MALSQVGDAFQYVESNGRTRLADGVTAFSPDTAIGPVNLATAGAAAAMGPMTGVSSALLQINAIAGGATVSAQGSLDNATWVVLGAGLVGQASSTVPLTSTGTYNISNASGFPYIRVIQNGSGSATVLLRATGASSSSTSAGAASSVVVTNFPATQPVSAASLPLPSGAATAALQPAINADGGSQVHVQNFPATQPISASALPLPSGAALDASVTSLSAKFGALGQAAMAASSPVVISSNQSTLPINGPGAIGAVLSGNPLGVAGVDGGGLVRTVRTDTAGHQQFARVTAPVLIAQGAFTTVSNSLAQYVIPAGKVYRIMGLYGTLTSDATVGGRRVVISVWDASNNVLWSSPEVVDQAASGATTYASTNNSVANLNVIIQVTLVNFALPAGAKVGFRVTNTSGAADAWTNLSAIMEDESP